MRSLLALSPLLLLLPAAAPQFWFEADHNFAVMPPEASTVHARLETVDLLAAQGLVVETTGARILEARFVDRVEPFVVGDACRTFRAGGGKGEGTELAPAKDEETEVPPPHDEECNACEAWGRLPDPHCEIIAFTSETRMTVRTDPAGTTILSQELEPRIPGWPVEGEWVTLPSGVKYYDVEVGTGKEPRNSTSLVRTHFQGWLNDRSLFTSTYQMGRAMKGPLSGGIQGWKEALLSMRVGGKRKIIIPPEMGYGAAGKAPQVPPHATLFFDVHLIGLPRQ